MRALGPFFALHLDRELRPKQCYPSSPLARSKLLLSDLPRHLLSIENPDLVVLTGDNIAPNGPLRYKNCLRDGGSRGCWHAMVQPMVKLGYR